jgi:phage tail sheath gpL-like
MNKLILTLATCLTLGFTASAQNYAIYEGLNSTTDISGTTVQVQVGSSTYEGFFFGKNFCIRFFPF